MAKSISPSEAARLVEAGALLVDVREPGEFARERIAGAANAPLSRGAALERGAASIVVFHCQSGARTGRAAASLADAAGCETYIVEGGIEAWKRAGLPVVGTGAGPLPMMRQVQITAGALAFLGFVLGVMVSPSFHLVSGFIGAGLVFSGATGTCGMARVLEFMPWNRATAGA